MASTGQTAMDWAPVAVAVALVVVVGVAGATPAGQVDERTVDVGLTGGESLDGAGGKVTLEANATTTVQVVVEGATDGVGAVDLSLAVEDPTIATIENVTLASDGEITDTAVDENGTTATASAIGLDESAQQQVVLTVTVAGVATGSTGLDLQVDDVGDTDGQSYDVQRTDGVTLTVPSDDQSGGETTQESSFPFVPVAVGAAVVLGVAVVLYRRRS